jgi:hypothetical protein
MNKNFFAGLFAGLCLLAIFAFKPAEDKPAVLQKWEYYRISVATPSVADAQMKVAGMQGWELVATLGNQTYLFKRPKQ